MSMFEKLPVSWQWNALMYPNKTNTNAKSSQLSDIPVIQVKIHIKMCNVMMLNKDKDKHACVKY